MRLSVLLLVSLFLLVAGSFCVHRRKPTGGKPPDIQVTGVIINVNEVTSFNGYGILTLKILRSTVNKYDPRSLNTFYYCVIKDSIAEFYLHAYNEMLGDTVNIDTKKATFSFGSPNYQRDEGSIHLNTSESYYKYIAENTKFK